MVNYQEALKNLGQLNATALNRKRHVKVFPTGLPKFDAEVLGTGGFVAGKIYEFYAKHSAGKTSLALKIAGYFQKQQLLAAYLDAEEALYLGNDESQNWVEGLGVDLNSLIMPNFQSGEQAFAQIKTMIASGINLIITDTIAALQPEAMIMREEEKVKMNEKLELPAMLTNEIKDLIAGFQASRVAGKSKVKMEIPPDRYDYLTKDLKMSIQNKLIHKLSYYDCVVIGINHAKAAIGVLHGDPVYSPGGAALGFYSSVRIGMGDPFSSKEKVVDPVSGLTVPLFRKTMVRSSKNKQAPPFNSIALKIYRDGRVEEDIVFWQEAVKLGLCESTQRTVTIIATSEKFMKKEFELWAVDHPDFFKGKINAESFDAVEEEIEEPLKKEEPRKKVSLRDILSSKNK